MLLAIKLTKEENQTELLRGFFFFWVGVYSELLLIPTANINYSFLNYANLTGFLKIVTLHCANARQEF